MSEHTPGPWKVTEPWNVVRTSADRVVAEAAYIGDTDTEKANTRLIAAAPDLLAALKALIAPMCSREVNGFSDERVMLLAGDYADNKANYDAARAAIAKAEGKGECGAGVTASASWSENCGKNCWREVDVPTGVSR